MSEPSKNKKLSGSKIFAILLIILLFAIVFARISVRTDTEREKHLREMEEQYQYAVLCVDEGRYIDALEVTYYISGYKDSDEIAIKCFLELRKQLGEDISQQSDSDIDTVEDIESTGGDNA